MLRLKRLNCSVKLFMTNREKRSMIMSSLSFSTRFFNFHHYDSIRTFFFRSPFDKKVNKRKTSYS